MKFTILLEMLFQLLSKRKVTATFFAEKYSLSVRTVYRYVELLSQAVPVYVKRGRNGGIFLPDSFKLPVGFMTEEEYDATVEALSLAYADRADERFLNAKRKLAAQYKTENRELPLVGDVGCVVAEDDVRTLSDKLRLLQDAVTERELLEIEYLSRSGEKTQRKIEPHALAYRRGVWLIHAFCRKQRGFRTLFVGRIFSALRTGEHFSRRSFSLDDIPLEGTQRPVEHVEVRLEISPNALEWAQERFGVEQVRRINGKWYADALLPNDGRLPQTVLAMGADVKAVAPKALQQEVAKAAQSIAKLYS